MIKHFSILLLTPLISSSLLFAKESYGNTQQKSLGAVKSALDPEMVELPGAHFRMGDISGFGFKNQKPVHEVAIQPFQMSKYEISKGEFALFIKATGYRTDAEKNIGNKGCLVDNNGNWDWVPGSSWRDPVFKQGDKEPVVCVSWNDANAYANWLKGETGKDYRLPTEAEWEYAARAGGENHFPWGGEPSHEHANYGKDECCGGVAIGRDRWVNTSPAGAFPANAFGLHDMHGNVWEWTADCWNSSYKGSPTDGAAWNSGDCGRRVLRGGSWDDKPMSIRSAHRFWEHIKDRGNYIGFRLALSLPRRN